MRTLEIDEQILLYDGVQYTLPMPPLKSDILFHDLPKVKQKWYRPDIEQEYYDAEDKLAFETREFKRRIHGLWFYNFGTPTYITGHHYYELTYCRFADGYFDFRDTAKRWWYWWDICEKDTNCLGTLRAKFRRLGATSDGEAMMLNIATLNQNILCGITSKTSQDAKEMFLEIVNVIQTIPQFALPPMEGKDRSKSEISFREPAKTLTTKNATITKSNSLNSKIDFRATVNNAYDGRKLKILCGDEGAKFPKDVSFSKYWAIHQTCLIMGREVFGKAYLPSTINEMENGGKGYKEVWDLSDYNKRNSNGRTMSGLYRYFNPAFDGLQGFIDEYGFSVIDTPTPAQAKFIGSTIGAREYLENERKALEHNHEELYEKIRQFPFTEEEAFLVPNKGSQFNLIKIQQQMDYNRIAILDGSLIIQPGNFIWKDGVQDSIVEWVPMKNGKWEIAWFPKPECQNKFSLKNGKRFPSFHNEGVIGIDPVDKGKTNFERQSMYSAHGFRYDSLADPTWSNMFYSRYVNRLPVPEDHWEDMIKQAVFYGYPTFGEANNIGTINYFRSRGYNHYLLNRPEPLRAKGGTNLKDEKWLPSKDAGIRQLQLDGYQSFIENHVGHIEALDDFYKVPKLPFNPTLDQLTKYVNGEDLTDWDEIVSSMFALSSYKRTLLPKVEVKQTYVPYVPVYKNEIKRV